MTAVKCAKEGCTVAETGTCLLHGEPSNCEFFTLADNGAEKAPTEESQIPPEDSKAPGPRRFFSGYELGTMDAARLMSGRYAHFVAILGCANVGKTCFLTSLYLLASAMQLERYAFAGSRTLRGFEERARRLRNWEPGTLPQELAEHTTTTNPRTPALMHIALQGHDDGQRYEVLLTDLPGEWSQHLIDRAKTAERFSFLQRADGIVLMIDAPQLINSETRHNEHRRARLLLTRLADTVGVDREVPLILFLSKSDVVGMARPSDMDAIEAHARSLGFSPETISGASFSEHPETVPNGAGVARSLEAIIGDDCLPPKRFVAKRRAGARSFVNFRHDD